MGEPVFETREALEAWVESEGSKAFAKAALSTGRYREIMLDAETRIRRDDAADDFEEK